MEQLNNFFYHKKSTFIAAILKNQLAKQLLFFIVFDKFQRDYFGWVCNTFNAVVAIWWLTYAACAASGRHAVTMTTYNQCYAYPSTGEVFAGYVEIGFYLCCDVVASQLCAFCCRIKDLFYYTMSQAYLLYDYYEST